MRQAEIETSWNTLLFLLEVERSCLFDLLYIRSQSGNKGTWLPLYMAWLSIVLQALEGI